MISYSEIPSGCRIGGFRRIAVLRDGEVIGYIIAEVIGWRFYRGSSMLSAERLEQKFDSLEAAQAWVEEHL